MALHVISVGLQNHGGKNTMFMSISKRRSNRGKPDTGEVKKKSNGTPYLKASPVRRKKAKIRKKESRCANEQTTR